MRNRIDALARISQILSLLLWCVRASCPSLSNANYAILGPFPSAGNHFGGGDPLEAFGGIANIAIDEDIAFHSELVVGGIVKWRNTTADREGILDYGYPQLDYGALRFALGVGVSSNLRSWAVTSFRVDVSGRYQISCGNVHSYFVDDKEMIGDPYAISSWWGPNGWFWLPIHLTQGTNPTSEHLSVFVLGTHILRVKFHWKFQCRIKCLSQETRMVALTPDAPTVFNPGLVNILPSIVEGQLAAPFLSIPIVSTHSVLDIVSAHIVSIRNNSIPLQADANASIALIGSGHVLPGQAFPLPLNLSLPDMTHCQTVQLLISLGVEFEDGSFEQLEHEIHLQCVQFSPEVPFTFTFLDVDGSVQYGTARPPPDPCVHNCSLIFALHGSDVDPGSPSWTNAIPSQNNTWIVMPSNRDKYGYDWQGIGLWSAIQCLQTFLAHLPGVPPDLHANYAVDPLRIVLMGHSMGGHGCLLLSVHFPDWILGSLCGAAWIRFDHYVQEFQGSQSSHMDGTLKNVLEAAVAEYHSDLLVTNIKGIPFMARMGSRDQSVCPWNLRRFARLVDEVNGKPGFAIVSEIRGQPHWFDGVLSDRPIQDVLSTVLGASRPLLPFQFEIRAMHLWSGGRGGLKILQFHTPFVLARIRVQRTDADEWRLVTENVRRFELQFRPDVAFPVKCIVDNRALDCIEAQTGHFCQRQPGTDWQICNEDTWKQTERHAANSGPMRQIFQDRVVIVYGTKFAPESERLAELSVHVANLLTARGHALIPIYADTEMDAERIQSNVILLGGPERNALTAQLLSGRASLASTTHLGWSRIRICGQEFISQSIGAAVLGSFTTRQTARLMVIVTGTDLEGIQNAVHLVPTAPNSEIPDYVVIGDDFKWKGSGSILAAGYWGNFWECRPDISYPRTPVSVRIEL